MGCFLLPGIYSCEWGNPTNRGSSFLKKTQVPFVPPTTLPQTIRGKHVPAFQCLQRGGWHINVSPPSDKHWTHPEGAARLWLLAVARDRSLLAPSLEPIFSYSQPAATQGVCCFCRISRPGCFVRVLVPVHTVGSCGCRCLPAVGVCVCVCLQTTTQGSPARG